MTSNDNNMHKVLTIGPSLKTLGGMASVLKVYEESVPGFKHLASNSPRGTVPGLFALAATLLRMPIERLRGRSVLHVHTASGKSFVRKSWIMRYGRLLGYKIIYHCHGAESKEYFQRIGLPKAKNTLDLASAVVVLSQSWKDYFESTFGLGNVHVIYNPIALPENPPMPASASPLELLFLGRFGDRKGIFDLLSVIAANQQRWRGRVHLRAGGDGEVDRFKEMVSREGISDMVDYIGWVDGEAKEKAYAASHILVLPSYNEGLPISVLEGMAHAKPIISTPVGGIPEVVVTGVNGFLVEPGDKEALTKVIDCYLENPRQIDAHGRESRRLAERFSPQAITNQLKQLYQSL